MALRVDEWRLKMTENVNAALAKMNSGAERTASKFTRTQDRINQSIGRGAAGIKGTLSSAWKSVGESAGNFKNTVMSSLPLPPALSGGIVGMAGPLGIAVALAGALTMMLGKGVQAAEAFGVPFRELRNLNLDKTDAQLQALNDDLLKLSFDKGLNAEAITKGYYDIQSATGMYGKDVLDMTGRIGEAARVLNMDYSAAVNGVSKAMVAFKLKATDVDAIMASNAKTVQVGIVTFDQLAKSQTEYAGAAASVNQNLDTANKVFAVLSKVTKSAEVGATMVKGAFQDLGKQSTTDGFKKIGVNVFDAAGGMRQADDILKDLIPKLGQMSDKTFAALKEEIGGSEGLRGLLDYAKGSGDDLLRTFDQFDASKFDLNKAILQGNTDLDIMKDKLGNQVNAKFIELGQLVMPLVVGIMGGLNDVLGLTLRFAGELGGAWQWMKSIYEQSAVVRTGFELLFLGIRVGWDVVVAGFKLTLNAILTPIKAIGQALTGNFSGAWDTIKGGFGNTMDALKGGVSDIGETFQSSMDRIKGGKVDVEPVLGKMPAMDQEANPLVQGVMPSAFQRPSPLRDKNAKAPLMPGQVEKPKALDNAKPATPAKAKADPFAKLFAPKAKEEGSNVKKGVNELSGGSAGGKQVRNVTINIQSLVKELRVYAGSMKESTSDIKRHVEEALIRAVQGTELVVAND